MNRLDAAKLAVRNAPHGHREQARRKLREVCKDELRRDIEARRQKGQAALGRAAE